MVRLGFESPGLRCAALVLGLALCVTWAGCKETDSLFCCSTLASCQRNGGSGPVTPCTDPERPHCDDDGYFGLARTCVADPGGEVCRGPADCSAERPVCLGHVCVECESDAECEAEAPVCIEETHLCAGCSDDRDCSEIAGAPHCLVAEGTCVACVEAEDCGGDTPICEANTCVGCAGPEDCGGVTPICESGTCRGCAADAECVSEVCDRDGGACFDEANVIYMSPGGQAAGTCTREAPCDSFARAIDQVTEGRNVIKAAPGTYEGQVVIEGIRVTILAEGATVQPPPNETVVSVVNDGDATIEGLTVTGALGGGTTIAVTCSDSRLQLRRSSVIGNTGGGGISITACEFSLVNNVIANNGNAGSAFGGVLISQIAAGGLQEFSFNSVIGNVGATNAVTGVECTSVLVPLTFSNNIVFGNQVSGSGVQVGGDSDCSWTYSDIGPQTVAGTGNINQDPTFVDAEKRDFHLRPESPARDAADPAATLTRDIDGDARPAGKRSDMGADEVAE